MATFSPLETKPALREKLLFARQSLSASDRELAAGRLAARASDFWNSLLASSPTLAALAPPQIPIALYAALPGELDCFPLLERLAAQNFPTLLPAAGAKATPLKFRLWRPGEKLVVGRFGLREPDISAPEMTPKIIFAPLLGFDAEGGRLGFGGGYYDATLAQLRREAPVLAGGLAFSCQQAERIPREKHDQSLDFVITEDRIFRFSTDP